MPAAQRIDPKSLFTSREWARLTRRNDWIALGLVVHAWAVILGAIALSAWQPWLVILAIPLIGARQLGLAILMHEAAHGGLHSNLRVNDWVGQWLCAAPVGASLKAYRPYHLTHHKYAQQPEDPDLALSAPFPVTRRSLRRKMVRDLTGQTFWKQRKNQVLNAFSHGLISGKNAATRVASARASVIAFVLTNLVLLAGLTLAGVWWAYFVLWLLPLATWNQLVTRLRNIAEHAMVADNADPMRHARTTRATWLEGLFIAPYWVNYHCEHHMFMYLPCYRLAEAHAILRTKGVTDRMEVREGYLGVLREAASKGSAAPA